jgi:hypothetical protein
MLKKIFLLLSLPAIGFAAENKAIIADNYKIGLGYSTTHNSKAYFVSGAYSAPLSTYTGFSLNGNLDKTLGENNVVDSTGSFISGSLLLRDYERGAISLNVGKGYSRFNLPSAVNGPHKADFNQYGVSSSYYLGNVTAGLARSAVTSNDAEDSNTAVLSLAWYPERNIRLQLTGSGMDEKDTYNFSIRYQPPQFANSTSLSLVYHNASDDNGIQADISYYFDTRVSLIDRDRKY